MFFIALLIATLIPILVFYLIRRLDLYQTGQFHYVVICALWGATAVFLATAVNRGVIQQGWVSRLEMVRFTAPFAEELLKVGILLYLVRRPKFTYFVDGAIYGFMVGIGFAVLENWQYILANQSEALQTAIGRVISTNLMHASASALSGIALGWARFERSKPTRLVKGSGGLLAAILLHMIFNNLVTRLNMGWVIVLAAALGVASAVIIALIIRSGLAEEKKWISEKLGMADRVTVGEAAAVQSLHNLQDILKPITAHFGLEKITQIERMLILQAQLGIRRKTLEAFTDPKMRQGILRQIEETRQEMDKLRRSLGPYIMVYLRTVVPEENNPVWALLANRLSEHLNSSPNSTRSLWATLGQRTPSKERTETTTETKNKPETAERPKRDL